MRYKKDSKILFSKKGFSLIELILYIGIISVFILVVFQFIFIFVDARSKDQTISEVEDQGAQALKQITQLIRNSEAITSPIKGESASSLTLDVIDPLKDPTIIDLSNGVIRIKEGVNNYINLTNDYVVVSDLLFNNVSKEKNTGIIKIDFTINFYNPNNMEQFNYEKIFTSGAEIKH